MSQKQEFAHILRGVGAVAVLLAHYCGTFFQAQDGLAVLLQVPPLRKLPELTGPARLLGEYCIVLGQFGVGVFFILSGFVIPFSMSPGNQMGFLKRRIFRIYPVYIAGFVLVIISIWLLTLFAGSKFGYSGDHIVAHFGIISRGLAGYSRIDGISWTLEVELVFYLIMAIVGVRFMSKGALPFCIGAIVVAGLSILSTQLLHAGHQAIVGNTGLQLWAALLLVAGLAYHALFCGKLSKRAFMGIQLTVSVLLILVWLCSDRRMFHWQWIAGYFLAMAVFAASYLARGKVRSTRLLNHLANISYPVYVIHALLGYGVMYWMISNGAGAYAAIFGASLVVYILSLLLHVAIEKPFMRIAVKPVLVNDARSSPDPRPRHGARAEALAVSFAPSSQ